MDQIILISEHWFLQIRFEFCLRTSPKVFTYCGNNFIAVYPRKYVQYVTTKNLIKLRLKISLYVQIIM
jgi:hypothetical protein